MRKFNAQRSISIFCLTLLVMASNAVVVTAQICKADPEVARQRKIISRLDAASKAELWKRHLAYQVNLTSYSPEQRALILAGYKFISPDSYKVKPSSKPDARFAPDGKLMLWNKELAKNFTVEERMNLFVRIDSKLFNSFIDSIPAFVQVKFREGGNCICTSGGGECLGTGMSCEIGLPGFCTEQIGCGTLGLFQCKGKCTPFGSD